MRPPRPRLDTAVAVAAVAVFVVVANILAARHNLLWDLAGSGRLTLSLESSQVARAVDREMHIEVFVYPDATDGRDARYLLEQYQRTNPRIEYSLVDPDASPGAARVRAVHGYGTTRIRMGEREIVARQPSQQALTSGLLHMLRGEATEFCFVTGHGEVQIDSGSPDGARDAARLLRDNGYAVRAALLRDDESVAACDVLVMAGVSSPPLESELTALDEYLARDGKLLVSLDTDVDTGLEELLEAWGIRFGRGYVLDPVSSVGGDPNVVITERYGSASPVVDGLTRTVSVQPRPVRGESEPGRGLVVSELAVTSEHAVVVARGSDEAGVLDEGRVPIGVAADLSEVGGEEHRLSGAAGDQRIRRTRVLALGDTDWMTGTFLGLADNRQLLLNAAGWLAEKEDLIGIETGTAADLRVTFTAADHRTIYLVVVGLVPAAPLAWGGFWWLRRRR